mmetsp:Transcript_28480/g.68505  ORF Transcript_28480/g.68505 Transcript_28480/m.68505 type:complete len:231 (+) Transcript_28480:58-750(+)
MWSAERVIAQKSGCCGLFTLRQGLALLLLIMLLESVLRLAPVILQRPSACIGQSQQAAVRSGVMPASAMCTQGHASAEGALRSIALLFLSVSGLYFVHLKEKALMQLHCGLMAVWTLLLFCKWLVVLIVMNISPMWSRGPVRSIGYSSGLELVLLGIYAYATMLSGSYATALPPRGTDLENPMAYKMPMPPPQETRPFHAAASFVPSPQGYGAARQSSVFVPSPPVESET